MWLDPGFSSHDDFMIFRLFQEDLHQPLPWELGNFLNQRTGKQPYLLGR